MSSDKELLKRLESILPEWNDPYTLVPIQQHVVLDSTTEVRSDDNVQYVSNLLTGELHPQDDNLEAYFQRYSTELEYIESQGYVNMTKLAFWKASSFKPSNPIECAIDDEPTTFWQSDGLQPHKIDVHFSKRVDITQIALYFCLVTDESYTPELFKIYTGFSPSDASLYKSYVVKNVNGWVLITFNGNRPSDDLLRCRFLQIQILSNHENGKDSHLRGIKIFGNGATVHNGPSVSNDMISKVTAFANSYDYQALR